MTTTDGLLAARVWLEPQTRGKTRSMAVKELDGTFSVQDVAKGLGISDETVYRRIRSNELDAVRIGTRVLVLKQHLVDAIERGLGSKLPDQIDWQIQRAQERERSEARAAEERNRARYLRDRADPNSPMNVMAGKGDLTDAEPGTAGTRVRVLGNPRVQRIDPRYGPIPVEAFAGDTSQDEVAAAMAKTKADFYDAHPEERP
jgi:excisionase family DNA binding protein